MNTTPDNPSETDSGLGTSLLDMPIMVKTELPFELPDFSSRWRARQGLHDPPKASQLVCEAKRRPSDRQGTQQTSLVRTVCEQSCDVSGHVPKGLNINSGCAHSPSNSQRGVMDSYRRTTSLSPGTSSRSLPKDFLLPSTGKVSGRGFAQIGRAQSSTNIPSSSAPRARISSNPTMDFDGNHAPIELPRKHDSHNGLQETYISSASDSDASINSQELSLPQIHSTTSSISLRARSSPKFSKASIPRTTTSEVEAVELPDRASTRSPMHLPKANDQGFTSTVETNHIRAAVGESPEKNLKDEKAVLVRSGECAKTEPGSDVIHSVPLQTHSSGGLSKPLAELHPEFPARFIISTRRDFEKKSTGSILRGTTMTPSAAFVSSVRSKNSVKGGYKRQGLDSELTGVQAGRRLVPAWTDQWTDGGTDSGSSTDGTSDAPLHSLFEKPTTASADYNVLPMATEGAHSDKPPRKRRRSSGDNRDAAKSSVVLDAQRRDQNSKVTDLLYQNKQGQFSRRMGQGSGDSRRRFFRARPPPIREEVADAEYPRNFTAARCRRNETHVMTSEIAQQDSRLFDAVVDQAQRPQADRTHPPGIFVTNPKPETKRPVQTRTLTRLEQPLTIAVSSQNASEVDVLGLASASTIDPLRISGNELDDNNGKATQGLLLSPQTAPMGTPGVENSEQPKTALSKVRGMVEALRNSKAEVLRLRLLVAELEAKMSSTEDQLRSALLEKKELQDFLDQIDKEADDELT